MSKKALLITSGYWWLSGSAIDLDFVGNRYYEGTDGQDVTNYLSCSRASVGYAKNSSGTWVSFGNDTLRITDLGLLVEDARTNNLLNSATPITQTTGILATGVYTLWVEGTGSALASGGTATITGAASATDGSPNIFTVTVGGTVIVTVTGSLDRFQLELGTFPSSFISTTVTAAMRAADVVTCIGNLNTIFSNLPHSVVADIIELHPEQFSGQYAGILGNTSNYNTLLEAPASDTQVGMYNGAGGHLIATLGNSKHLSTGVKIASAQDVSGRSIVGGGGTVATDATSQAISDVVAGISLNIKADVYFRRLTAWNTRLADATLQGFTI